PLCGVVRNQTSIEERAIRYLAKMPEAISKHGGHNRTFAAARVVVYGFDLGPEDGFRILWKHFNPRCRPEWSEKELGHKCEDADTKPYWEPRGWLLTADKKHESNGHAKAEPPPRRPTSPEPWDTPIPLGEIAKLPAFPANELTEWLSAWVKE